VLATVQLPVVVSQSPPCAQSLALEHDLLQTPVLALQPKGEHGSLVLGAHLPVPSQVGAGVETSPLQLAVPQATELPG